MNWFNENKMTVNLGMSYVITVDERKQDHTYEILKIGSKENKILTQVKLLGIEIHDGLNFVPHLIFFFFFFLQIGCKPTKRTNKIEVLLRFQRKERSNE